MAREHIDSDVYRFLNEQVDTVPQLEALLLLWESRPKEWVAQELAQRLYIGIEAIVMIMPPLAQRKLIAIRNADVAFYRYESSTGADRLMEAVVATYRRNLVRATAVIHSQSSSGVLEFARAFKFKKGND